MNNNNLTLLRVGVIGVGSIGQHHARIYSGLEGVRLVGIVDIDSVQAQEIALKYNCKAYKNYTEIINSVDAVSIAAPTTLHHRISMDFLKHDKDILVEKPITSTMHEADEIIAEAEKRGLILQVGHLERFNAGVSVISSMVDSPKFIESRRLSPFSGRGTDVDVTLDLMIHDIDIILSLVNSDISELRAAGAKVLTENIDIAHAWIEFKNGCIAEAVTSRIADEKVRELKIFQHNAFLSLDYQTQEVSCYKKLDGGVGREVKRAEKKEPLKEQLISFVECVRKRTRPVVSGHEGREALKVALKVSELVNNANN
jgi:predicted dehydrogenase